LVFLDFLNFHFNFPVSREFDGGDRSDQDCILSQTDQPPTGERSVWLRNPFNRQLACIHLPVKVVGRDGCRLPVGAGRPRTDRRPSRYHPITAAVTAMIAPAKMVRLRM
jgi:hypothetical protein